MIINVDTLNKLIKAIDDIMYEFKPIVLTSLHSTSTL